LASGGEGPSDETLAARAQRGDRAALERLVRRYLRPVHSVAASFLRERADVEDAVQESFLRALDNIAKYDPARPFAPWLYRVARNVARDRRSAIGRRLTERIEGDDFEEASPRPDATLELAEIRRRVAAAMERLPEQRRTAFRLHDVDGFTTGETARIMGLSEGTIRSHVHHARHALRGLLADRPDLAENTRKAGG
jgi:RNA polymerase sigma-70 factor (ECF subfamily)